MSLDNGWNEIYDRRMMTMWEPQQSIVQFISRFVRKRVLYDTFDHRRSVDDVLDLGCGNGSAVHFLLKMGFRVTGVDISEAAISLAKDYLSREGLQAELDVASCEALPYENNSFDVVVSYGVLDHVLHSVARGAVAEVKRVLRPGGLFFAALCSTRSSQFGVGEKVETHCYKIAEGFESGQVQHYFDFEEVRDLLREFKILDLRHNLEETYYENGLVTKFQGRRCVASELR